MADLGDRALVLEPLPPAVEAWMEAHPDEVECVRAFVSLMMRELAANSGKGNRGRRPAHRHEHVVSSGWLAMGRKEAVGEIHWHASKLAVAAKALEKFEAGEPVAAYAIVDDFEAPVREYAADVANCAMMALDVMGLLDG